MNRWVSRSDLAVRGAKFWSRTKAGKKRRPVVAPSCRLIYLVRSRFRLCAAQAMPCRPDELNCRFVWTIISPHPTPGMIELCKPSRMIASNAVRTLPALCFGESDDEGTTRPDESRVLRRGPELRPRRRRGQVGSFSTASAAGSRARFTSAIPSCASGSRAYTSCKRGTLRSPNRKRVRNEYARAIDCAGFEL